ncbi:MAG: hypothetical protein ACOCVZ_07715, partial [Gemmatimonadota bacterium]
MITQTRAAERTFAGARGSKLSARIRRLALPILITLLVAAGAIFGPPALSDGVTGAAVSGARLEVGWTYVLMAPVTNVLDTLSVLTLGQHYAVLATLIVVFAAWRMLRGRRRLGWLRRVGVELGVALASLLGLATFYGYGIVGPRPMAALAVDDPDIVVVDVHSHTDRSHDARRGFDAEANREWHASAGFDAAYISDHRNWDGYSDAIPGNPQRAGEGTSLLPAIEIKYARRYACALGMPWQYRNAASGNTLIQDSVYRVYRETGARPTLVLT